VTSNIETGNTAACRTVTTLAGDNFLQVGALEFTRPTSPATPSSRRTYSANRAYLPGFQLTMTASQWI